VYCTRCGTKNEDDAAFCKKCGNNLQGPTSGPEPQVAGKSKQDEECERDCKGSDRESTAWWGIIVVIIGAWVIWEFALKHVIDEPKWFKDDAFCMAIWIMVGIAVLAAGMRMMMRRSQQQ
jgi:uncharacterized membrane protein YvbJ